MKIFSVNERDYNMGTKNSAFKKKYRKRVDRLKENKIIAYFIRNKFCYISALIAAVIIFFIFVADISTKDGGPHKIYPFGIHTVLRIDLYHQYGPLLAELYERIVNFDSLLYSWSSGLGGSFLGNFLNYLASPFSLSILLVGHKQMPEAIAMIMLLAASFSAGTFTYYLKRSQDKHSIVTAAFGILYGLCGYYVAFSWNIMWMDAMVIFPIVILGVEEIIKGKKMRTYIFAMTYAMFTSYYMAFMICIASALYFFVYYLSHNTFSDKINPLLGRPLTSTSFFKIQVKRLQNSKFFNTGFKFAASSLAAFGIVAVLFFPLYFILEASSATGHSFPTTLETFFKPFDFLANHFAGVTPTIWSSGDDVFPNIYSGVLTLVLVPLYFYTKKISLREKMATLFLLAFFFFSFNTNILNFVMHGFKNPNDLPFRYSYMYSFFIIAIAARAFTFLSEFSGKHLLTIGISLLGFVVLVDEIGSKNVTNTVVWTTIAYVVVYVLILTFIKNPKYSAYSLSSLLIFAVCTEIAICDTQHIYISVRREDYVGDYDSFQDVRARVDAREPELLFTRSELTNQRARMDSSWYYFNGISVFSSMAYENVAKMCKKLGMRSNNINSQVYYPQTPVYNSMFALRYLYDKNDSKLMPSKTEFYTEIETGEKFTAYSYDYYLPIAYAVNPEVSSDWNIGKVGTDGEYEFADFNSISPLDIQEDFFSLATGVQNVFDPLEMKIEDFVNCKDIAGYKISDPKLNYELKDKAKDGSFTLVVDVPKTQNVYVYGSSGQIEKVTCNGKDFTVKSSDSYLFDAGLREAGDKLELKVKLPKDTATGSINITAVGLDADAFKEGYKRIEANGTFEVTEFKERKITGSINVSGDNKLLYTSIPYDEGWSVKIDGNKVPVSEYKKVANALLAVMIPEGEHTVVFSYFPKGMTLGAGVSVLTIAILYLCYRMLKKKVFVFNPAYADDGFVMLEDEPIAEDILPDGFTQSEFTEMQENGNSGDINQ